MSSLSIRNSNHSPFHPDNIRDFGEAARLTMLEILNTAMEVARILQRDTKYPKIVTIGKDREQEAVEQRRILENITIAEQENFERSMA